MFIAEIRDLHQQIIAIEDEIRKKEQALNDLDCFKKQHSKKLDDISQNFYERSQRIKKTASSVSELNFYQNYREVMAELLIESEKYLHKSEEEHLEITRVMKRIEQEIVELTQEIQNHEIQLSDLNNQLKLERIEKTGE